MWSKIKKALIWIGGGLVAVLFFVLGIKNRKIKKTEEQLESVEEKLVAVEEAHLVEEKLEEVSQIAEEEAEDRMSEVEAETAALLAEEVKLEDTGKKYNEIIGNWNNEGT
jgi:hypothetical protein